MNHDLIMARRAELCDRMAIAVADGNAALIACLADEMAFLVALLRDLRDESYRQEGARLAAETYARWEREGWSPT